MIVPGETPVEMIEQKVSELLEPYDENMQVEPYKVYLDEDERANMVESYKCDVSDLAALAGHMQHWDWCEGSVDEQGLYKLSTRNPQSKWDWWVIGGRWNGVIQHNPENDREGGFNFGEQFRRIERNRIERNMIPAQHVDSPLQAHTFVTPDGEWHEQGRMGWFATISDAKDESAWEDEGIRIVQKHIKDILVGVDCHI